MRTILTQLVEFFACMRRLRPHLRGGRFLMAAVIITSLMMTFFEAAGVGLLVPLLSLLLGGENATPMRPIQYLQILFPNHEPNFYVAGFCCIIVGMISLKNIMSYITTRLSLRLRRRVKMNLRGSLFKQVQALDLQQFDQRPAGEFANIFLVETDRTTGALEMTLVLSQRLSMVCVYFGLLFYISITLTLITLFLGLALGFAFASIYKTLLRAGGQLSESNRKLAGFLVETFAGMRVIRTTNSQERVSNKFYDLNNAQASAEARGMASQAVIPAIAEVLGVIGGMVTLGYGYVAFVNPGYMRSSYLLVFAGILLKLLPMLNFIYGLQGSLLWLTGGAHELEKWLNLPQHPQKPFGDKIFDSVKEAIRFEGITHEYPVGRPALRNLNLTVPAGKTVALVGPSGAGKSTVAALLLRLRQPQEGRITVDGVDFWNFEPASWHRNVAVVEQEAFLFHDTLAANIAFGFPEATAQTVLRAIEQANLGDFVRALPEGVNTIVGERGYSLSGGQRQRLAIARALVREPRMLILDEATSNLDAVSEQAVQAAIRQASVGRTVLVIAHRLSTIRDADRIVVMDQGSVVEEGTWDQLAVRENGAFANLLRLNARNNSLELLKP